jgi:glycosyltransferase involved in cell wall biosynthesis
VEAMLAQCPIASTAVGGSREVLGVDANDVSPFAATFAPGDVESAVAAIENGLSENSTNQQRLERAQEWATQNFSIEQMVRKHLAFYRSLVEADSPAECETHRSAA